MQSVPQSTQAGQPAATDSQNNQVGGPVRLRQPGAGTSSTNGQPGTGARTLPMAPARVAPSEFEAFVQRIAQPIETRRFGAELMEPALETRRFGTEMMTPTDEADVAETCRSCRPITWSSPATKSCS